MFDTSCDNMLVRGVNWIGDTVMTIPALRVLKRALPATRLSLLVKPWVSPLFEKDPDIHEILLYGNKHTGPIGKIRLSHMLRKKHFCSSVLFQNAFDAALIAYLAGIRQRIGYNRDGRGLLLTGAIPVTEKDKKIHQIYYYLHLLEYAGLKNRYYPPYIFLSPEEKISTRSLLRNLRRPVLGINPGATYGSAKKWLPERFAEIANWFIGDTGGSVLIFGSRNEASEAQQIEHLIRLHHSENTMLKDNAAGYTINRENPGNMIDPFPASVYPVLNLAGRTSLRELISCISECDVFVSNDSGPMHIAYAVGTPLVAIFGSTDPGLTGPPAETAGGDAIVIKTDFSCSPCFKRTCGNKDMRCMYSITSEDVYHAVKAMLPGGKAVFFDRDGTLCRDAGYLNSRKDFMPFEDISTVLRLKEQGFRLIGISNQSGIARGTVNEDFVKEINSLFLTDLGFDGFYYCPHHPDEHCSCRKPEPGMLFRARTQHKTDFSQSYMVGDKESDMLLAKAVGAKGVYVTTGENKESSHADFMAGSLKEATDIILMDSR